MIQILSGIITGHGRHITTRKAFFLSLVYVLAMALTYTVVGVLVGLSGENIQAWLDKAQAGEFEAAWRILVENNPMPSVHGRVCYHPCESACNRGQVDEPVAGHITGGEITDEVTHGWYAGQLDPRVQLAFGEQDHIAVG